MKLFEIINIPDQRNIKHARALLSAYPNAPRSLMKLPRTKGKVQMLGQGIEAVVFKDPNDIGVTKVMTTATRDPDIEFALANVDMNPYVKYAYISRRQSNHNPYLPRIEKITKQHVPAAKWKQMQVDSESPNDSSGFYDHPPYLISIQMEQLVSAASLDLIQLQALYLRTFGELQDDTPPSNSDRSDRYRIIRRIAGLLDTMLNGGELPSNVEVDDRLIAAVKTIRAIQKKTRTDIDMHDANFMVRMSIGGPQVVITDPLVRV